MNYNLNLVEYLNTSESYYYLSLYRLKMCMCPEPDYVTIDRSGFSEEEAEMYKEQYDIYDKDGGGLSLKELLPLLRVKFPF